MAPRKKADDASATSTAGAGTGAAAGAASRCTASEAAEMVVGYLRSVNRPYSAIDVSANLHNRVSKAAASKILKELHERGTIEGRASGKQLVYHAMQDPTDALSPAQLAALDTRAADLRTETLKLQASAKTLRTQLAALNSTLSTADLVAGVGVLEKEKAELEQRLEMLRKGEAKKVTKRERDEVDAEWTKLAKVARKRMKIRMEAWEMIEDAVEGDKEKAAEIREGLGLDE